MDPVSSAHQFIISDTEESREDNDYIAFQSYGINRNLFPQSVGLLPTIQSLEERMSRSMDLFQASETGSRRHSMNLQEAANETDHQCQRLSLTLGSHVLVPSEQYNSMIDGEARGVCSSRSEQIRNNYFHVNSTSSSSSFSPNRYNSSSCVKESFAAAVRNSRYLKPAQSLLEEVVGINNKAIDSNPENLLNQFNQNSRRGASGISSEFGINSTKKQNLQIRITKLVALLEQIESRYEPYYQQMEQVISSFEVIAGLGAARSYTAPALQAMSRHFCTLRTTIIDQINVTRRQLFQDSPRILHSNLSKLSFSDQLQQIGMFHSQRQPWKPIRGLPEISVTILHSWLFEHFLHPYPNDSEKLMLASQTGLTKNQVSNWFINARVRLWKPMIEEMYIKEFAASPGDSNP